MAEIITVDEKQYELKYNEKTIEIVESITGTAFMDYIINGKAMFPLAVLRQYFANAVYLVDGGKAPVEQGQNIFENVLKEKGYSFVNMLIVTTIQRDCPFFFRGA